MKKQSRQNTLLPGGQPKWVRCYDNGGITIDRYTVCFTRKQGGGTYIAMNASPFHPQGFGQPGETINGRSCDTNKWGFAPMIGRKNHLGTRIPFSKLPPDCQKLVTQDYKNIWNLA